MLVAGRQAFKEGQPTPARVLSLDYKTTSFRLYVVEDEPLAYRVYIRWARGEDVYEPVMLECLTRLLRRMQRPGFMDIGSYMGHYACYAAALLADSDDVYAIESNPRYFAATLRSIALNGFTRVSALNEVLSDRVELLLRFLLHRVPSAVESLELPLELAFDPPRGRLQLTHH